MYFTNFNVSLLINVCAHIGQDLTVHARKLPVFGTITIPLLPESTFLTIFSANASALNVGIMNLDWFLRPVVILVVVHPGRIQTVLTFGAAYTVFSSVAKPSWKARTAAFEQL